MACHLVNYKLTAGRRVHVTIQEVRFLCAAGSTGRRDREEHAMTLTHLPASALKVGDVIALGNDVVTLVGVDHDVDPGMIGLVSRDLPTSDTYTDEWYVDYVDATRIIAVITVDTY